MNCIGHGTSLEMSSAPSSAGAELPRATQSSPLPSSPPFMSDACSSIAAIHVRCVFLYL
ncbi:hypothetical protein [Treponema endosymbiont of Eucomonympha sp.]|uniref:hypothetical protein n=1 Tax=Treponema endosymbiont of Eucomonympha sp. TaxID=1580831 RepID=UPI00359F3B20